MVNNNRAYIINFDSTNSAIRTIIQIKSGANRDIEIVRAEVTNPYSATSAQAEIAFVRFTTNPCGVASFTPLALNPNDEVAGTTNDATSTGTFATTEGSVTETTYKAGFNVVSGWLYLPVPDERIVIKKGSNSLGLKFTVAPPNINYKGCIIFREI